MVESNANIVKDLFFFLTETSWNYLKVGLANKIYCIEGLGHSTHDLFHE